ncbi:MAG: hypothetical protein IK100_04975 [Muribaculaceae bacterium]|nr:hypothetical protein [Muribaculaceae bacterium]MBR5117981.1 hypothetical protein [Muribaculaceae bacterium]
MRKLLLICLMTLAVLTIDASNKYTVSMVKQYSDSAFVLPKKAIEKKMKCVKAAKDDYVFPKMLKDTLNRLQDDDSGNSVFIMLLTGSGKGIKIDVKSEDLFDNDSTTFFGDFIVGRKHFVMIQNEDNIELLKIFFKKSGDSVVFQRLYEYTDNIVDYLPSSLNAFYDEYDKKFLIKEYIINGENRTDIKNAVITNNYDDDGDDAFKLDVELFE